MSPLKTKHLISFLVILISITVFFSCRKNQEIIKTQGEESILEVKFLKKADTSKPVFSKIVRYLKSQNKNHHLITLLSKNFGFPLWNKSFVINSKNRLAQRANNLSSDSYDEVLIPLANDSINKISAMIAAQVWEDSIKFKLINPAEYKKYGFLNTSISPNANDVIGLTMYMENAIWGREYFGLLDSRLYSDDLSADSTKPKTVKFHKQSNSQRTSGEVVVELCWFVDNFRCGDALNPRCHDIVTTLDCVEIARFTVQEPATEFEEPETTPFSGGGGQGGGGVAPIVPMLDIDDIVSTNITTPCFRNRIDAIGTTTLKNTILKTFREVFSGEYGKHINLNFVETTTILDGNNQNKVESNTSVNKITDSQFDWTITLNSTLLNGKSNEYVTSVILHEISHAIITFKNIVAGGMPQTTLTQHQIMFEGEYINQIRDALIEIHGLTSVQATALALGGITDYTFTIDRFNPQIVTPNLARDADCQTKYNTTLMDAFLEKEKFRNGTSGTVCQ